MSRTLAMKRVIAPLLGALLTATAVQAQAQVSTLELKVKAAFLYNFARYVVWPAEKFKNPTSPFQICVLEPDPFGTVLDDTLRGKLVDTHPIVVSRSSRVQELRSCHIVYSALRDAAAAEAALAPLGGHGVMTVHEADGALRAGVARFFLDARKVRFEINSAALGREKLQLGPKLQNLAIVVQK